MPKKIQSAKPTESERTAIFTTAALKFLLRKPTEITKPYHESLKKGIGKAIMQFYQTAGSCPERIEISELRSYKADNRITVKLLVSGKNGKEDFSITYLAIWTGVRFNADTFDRITGREDVVVKIVGTGKTFQATGDFLFEHQNAYPMA